MECLPATWCPEQMLGSEEGVVGVGQAGEGTLPVEVGALRSLECQVGFGQWVSMSQRR